MGKYYLKDIAHGRSGDKGNISNICVFSRNPEDYAFLKEYLSIERVKEHFKDMVKGDVERYEVDSIKGLNFVLHEALGGGATTSLRLDSLGKSMASALMRMEIDESVYQSYKKECEDERK